MSATHQVDELHLDAALPRRLADAPRRKDECVEVVSGIIPSLAWSYCISKTCLSQVCTLALVIGYAW